MVSENWSCYVYRKEGKNDKTEGKRSESIAAPRFHACNVHRVDENETTTFLTASTQMHEIILSIT